MSRTTDSKKQIILDFINEYYGSYGETPTVRDIAAGTGIAVTSVHRYLSAMKEDGELEYNGRRSVSTRRMEMEQVAHAMPALGYVACGEGQEETEQVIEYIRMPESLVGKGEFFALIAKGESMIDAGIHPGDYVMIRKQNTADIGDIVVALDGGSTTLKSSASTMPRADISFAPATRTKNVTVTSIPKNSGSRALPFALHTGSKRCCNLTFHITASLPIHN